MKIRNVENLINVTLDMSFEDAMKVQKFAPEAMMLKDDNENQIFKVCIKDGSRYEPMGDLCEFAAEFVKVREKPTIWFGIDDIAKDDVEEYIVEHQGMSLAKIKKVEEQMTAALADVDTEVGTIRDAIDVL